MKTAKEILEKHKPLHCNSKAVLAAMEEYAKQYRMCALGGLCKEQCFTCSEDELNDFKNLNKAHVISSLPLFKCKCGYETYDSLGWSVHADCCNGNDL